MNREEYERACRRVGLIRHCSSCQREIIWLTTANGRRMPIDAETFTGDEPSLTYDPAVHRSHFATCPNAHRHRR